MSVEEILDQQFKFKPGEIAAMRLSTTRIIILDRVLRQCGGGIQRYYSARLFGEGGKTAIGELRDDEVRPLSELEAELAQRRAEQKNWDINDFLKKPE